MDAKEIKQIQELVLSAYEQQGFPRALIGGWAISTNDVADLIMSVQEGRPKKILEVGTYVGVSTMMLAIACPQAHIFTVDPNFELAREMQAVNAGVELNVNSPRHHDIARRAADALGLQDRITFVEGGFSVGDTFSSTLVGDGKRTDVVGPALCANQGPFDIVFIDGLHTPDAVQKDLQLASQSLLPNGSIVLHDCIGFWGASVRRGIMAFLRENPEFTFHHPPFADVYRSIGRVAKHCANDSFRKAGKPDPELSRMVTALARGVFGKRTICELAVAEPWLDTSANTPVLFALTPAAAASKLPAKVSASIVDGQFGGIVAIELADFGSDEIVRQILQTASKAGLAVLLGASPPGEVGIAGPHSRPLVRLLDIAQSAGMSLFLYPFADQEHLRYALLPEPRPLGLSSLLLNLLVAAPGPEFVDVEGRQYVRLTAPLALDHEQEGLERVHTACTYKRYHFLADDEQRKRLESSGALLQQLEASESRAQEIDLARAAERDLRLREGADLRTQLASATASAKQEMEWRFNVTADLTRQVEEQTAEADRLRRLVERLELGSGWSQSIEDALRQRTAERDVAISAAIESESAASMLRRQLMEVFGGLEDLDFAIRDVEIRRSSETAEAGSLPFGSEHPERLSYAISALKSRFQALVPELSYQCVEAPCSHHPAASAGMLENRISLLEKQNTQLNSEIDRIRRSMSWRLLGPWRVVTRKLTSLVS